MAKVTKFRPLADYKYQEALMYIGLAHGADYDCQRSECRVCLPFRTIEKQVWDGLTEEEQHEVVFTRFGL